MLDWIRAGGQPEAVSCGMQDLVAMVKLANSFSVTGNMASMMATVQRALKNADSLRRLYESYIGPLEASQKMLVVRHLLRAYVHSRVDESRVRL